MGRVTDFGCDGAADGFVDLAPPSPGSMRDLSSTAHRRVTPPHDDVGVRLVDRELPAAQYLVGADAIDVLRLPVEATGGRIESVHPVQVQYRPGSDVVVRYSAQVAWNDRPAVRETLVASSAVHGRHPGAVPVMADAAGGSIEVGVWRWPFDPVLVGLADAVTADAVARLLEVDRRGLRVDVVAFRPTDRAVVRVVRDDETFAYLKVVAPERTAQIAQRHRALLAAGVPVASVLAADDQRGLLVLEALPGPTLRELVKSGRNGWPPPHAFRDLADAFATAEVVGAGPASRLADGPLHARMLAKVLPDSAEFLHDLADDFESYGAAPIDGTVHGDLHEGQVIVADEKIVGVLDVDDVGPGSSIDDYANVIARFRFRAATTPGRREQLDAYASALRTDALVRHDAERLDVHTSAALVGLATGPFRIQSDGWRDTVRDLVGIAGALSMRELSA